MTRKLADKRQIGNIPKLYEVIVAAGRDEPAIRADRKCTNPAAMRFEVVLRPRRLCINLPNTHSACVVAAVEFATMKGQAANPASVTFETRLTPAVEFPTLDGIVLSAGEDETA